MSKKYLFYDRYKNIKKRLFELFLVMIFIFLGAGLGILKLSNPKTTGMGLETVYEDRVKPLYQLKKISDIYGIMIVDTANKVFLGTMSWQQGREHFEETIKTIPVLWNEYMETNLIAEEKKMAEELQILFHRTDVELIKFRNILINENYSELENFIKEGLYKNTEPIILKIDELYQIQIRIVREIKEYEKERFVLCSNLGTASIVISLILCLIVLLQWRRCRSLFNSL